jgi:hypothetical protein
VISTGGEPGSNLVNYIEMTNESKRRRGFNEQLSAVEYENRLMYR